MKIQVYIVIVDDYFSSIIFSKHAKSALWTFLSINIVFDHEAYARYMYIVCSEIKIRATNTQSEKERERKLSFRGVNVYRTWLLHACLGLYKPRESFQDHFNEARYTRADVAF